MRARARASRQWAARRVVASPRASFEEIEVRTIDGAILRAVVDDPPEGEALRGTAVLVHGLFSDKRVYGRRDAPRLSGALTARGLRTIAFDLRGHGDSVGPSPEFGLDELVRTDVPAVVEYARAHGEDRPVLAVGHWLGGELALAAHGVGYTALDGVVALAPILGGGALDPSRVRRAVHWALARAAHALTMRAGDLAHAAPSVARSALEAASRRHVVDLVKLARRGRWESADGRDDYLASFGRVTIPVAAVVAERDRLVAAAAAGEALARRCGGPVAIYRAPARGRALPSSPGAYGLVLQAVEWALAQARP